MASIVQIFMRYWREKPAGMAVVRHFGARLCEPAHVFRQTKPSSAAVTP